jgi:hypothetical protein
MAGVSEKHLNLGYESLNIPDDVIRVERNYRPPADSVGLPLPAFEISPDESADVLDSVSLLPGHFAILVESFPGPRGNAETLDES